MEHPEDNKEYKDFKFFDDEVFGTFTPEEEREYYEYLDKGIERERLTCFKCKLNNICEFAWDSYNTNGDCLALK